MNFSNKRTKEEENFPNIMTKEDTKELSNIINLLNSKTDNPDEKIGLNLQYRLIKIPENIYNKIKERNSNSKNNFEKAKKDPEFLSIKKEYDENKSKEELYIRGKDYEIDCLDKNIKQLHKKENELIQQVNNFKTKLDDLSQKITSTQRERDTIKNNIKQFELDAKNMKEKIAELDEINKINYEKIKKKNEYKNYLKEKKEVDEDEANIKKLLCFECQKQPRIIYYSKCQHLALCENCYNKGKQNSECPICHEISELIVKVSLEKTNI